MKLPWRTARNLNRIGGSMKHAQETCRGRERVKNFDTVTLCNKLCSEISTHTPPTVYLMKGSNDNFRRKNIEEKSKFLKGRFVRLG